MTYLPASTSEASIVTFDPSTRELSFFNDNDLTLSSVSHPYYQGYGVVVNGESGGLSDYLMILLGVFNPCVDPDFTSIHVPDDYQIDYLVNSDAMNVAYAAGFSVGNSEQVAALCGPISYSVHSTIPEIVDL